MKKKAIERKKKKVGPIIVAVVIIAIIISGIYYYNQEKKSVTEVQWQNVSGPFAINKFQYKLDEYVFMTVSNLNPTEAGKMIIIDPKGGVFLTIPFNGTLKTSFHQFFKPNTENSGGELLCTPKDLVGQWSIVFQGVSYRPMSFNVTNDWIEGGQAEIKPVPPELCK